MQAYQRESLFLQRLVTVEPTMYMTDYYSLDVIISVGYRVKSKRGVEFRRWANSVLKAYNFKLRLTSMQTIAIRERKVAVPISIRSCSF